MPDVNAETFDSQDFIRAIGDKIRTVAPPYAVAVFPAISSKMVEMYNLLSNGDFKLATEQASKSICCPGCVFGFYADVERGFRLLKERTELVRRLKTELKACEDAEKWSEAEIHEIAVQIMFKADDMFGGPANYHAVSVGAFLDLSKGRPTASKSETRH